MTISAAAQTTTALSPQQALDLLTQAAARATATDQLLVETIRLCAAALNAAAAAVWVTENPDQPVLLLQHQLENLGLLAQRQPLPGLNLAVRRAVREAKALIVPPFCTDHQANDTPVNPSPFELLFVPVRLHGKIALVAAFAVPAVPTDPTVHRNQINFLQRMVNVLEQALAARHLGLVERARSVASRIVGYAENIHRHLFLREVAPDIANLTRDAIAANRVTVELYPPLRRRVLAVSNVAAPNPRAAILQAQRLLLQYVQERNVPVSLNRAAAAQLVSDPALQDAAAAYFLASNFAAFLAAPVRHEDRVVGIILAEYASSENAQHNATLLSDLSRLCATAVANALAYEAIPFRRALHAATALAQPAGARKRCALYALAAGLLALLSTLCLVPVDCSLKADCGLQPVGQLAIVAPMEGRMIDLPVRAGQHVYPKDAANAQPLAVFDTTDLLAARAAQQQKEAQLRVQFKEAQDQGQIAKIGSLGLELQQVEGQIKLLNQQIDQATVYSPIEGAVLTENVEQKKWSSVHLGEPLMEIASFRDWILVVDVPEAEVAAVRDALASATARAAQRRQPDPGIAVDYILYPWPDRRYAIRAAGVATLLPASSQSKNANVFRMQIPVNPADLPPGIAMSGVTGRAKIHVGRQPLAQQWTHGLTRLLRMTILF